MVVGVVMAARGWGGDLFSNARLCCRPDEYGSTSLVIRITTQTRGSSLPTECLILVSTTSHSTAVPAWCHSCSMESWLWADMDGAGSNRTSVVRRCGLECVAIVHWSGPRHPRRTQASSVGRLIAEAQAYERWPRRWAAPRATSLDRDSDGTP